MTQLTTYLTGPMQGVKDLNHPEFNRWARILESYGLRVLNPATFGDPEGWPWSQFIARDLEIMEREKPEILFQLEGHRNSKGSAMELQTFVDSDWGLLVTGELNPWAVQIKKLIANHALEDTGFLTEGESLMDVMEHEDPLLVCPVADGCKVESCVHREPHHYNETCEMDLSYPGNERCGACVPVNESSDEWYDHTCFECENPITNDTGTGLCDQCMADVWTEIETKIENPSAASGPLPDGTFTGVKDSGVREEFDTGSRRDTREGKGRYDLIPAYPHKRLAQHYENGAVKYGDRNWEKGQPLSRYLDSAIRHLENVKAGMCDEDHPAAVVWNVYAFMWTQEQVRLGLLPETLNDVAVGAE